MPEPLCSAVLVKIRENVERTGHLMSKLPDERLLWSPPIPNTWPAAKLLGHLLECLAGLCAVLAAVEPVRLSHFHKLREMPVNHPCSVSEARARMAVYQAHIDEGFALLRDADLSRSLRTVFVEEGEPVLTLLLGNLEHLINHKHQLFTYLKLAGVEVGSRDLYHFRVQ